MEAAKIIQVQARVLRLVDLYLAEQDQNELWGAGGGMMNPGELRQHISAALKLRTKEKGKHRIGKGGRGCIYATREAALLVERNAITVRTTKASATA